MAAEGKNPAGRFTGRPEAERKGREFAVVAIHVTREEAAEIRRNWEDGLAELNRAGDGIPCVIACGFAFGEKDYDLDEVLALADARMYEDNKAKKLRAGQPPAR